MANFYTRSIRRKLILLFTATASLTVLIACSLLWVYQLHNYRTALKTEETATAQLIADSSGPALLFNDSPAAIETLTLLRADARIQLACLYNGNGKIVADFSPAKPVLMCPDESSISPVFSARRLVLVRSIKVQGETVGRLYLQVGLSAMYHLLAGLALAGLCVLLLTTLLASGISSFLERLISRPILHLTEVATTVSLSGNYIVRAERSSDDETGVLIDRFNAMMDYIQERERDLENARSGLEERVKERTS
jgi:methyl-accepting chemotaxis protein